MSLLRDLRLASRSLSRNRAVAIGAIVSFAIGIGATTTMFSIGHTLMAPLPFPEPERLVFVSGIDRARTVRQFGEVGVRMGEFLSLREQSRTVTAAAYEDGSAQLGDGKTPAERVPGAQVTGAFFEILGVRPSLGRGIDRGDEDSRAPSVVVIGHRVWTDRFHGDSTIVGRVVRIDGAPARIVGVMPADFSFPDPSGIWRPLEATPAAAAADTAPALQVVGRLRPGATFDQAASDIARLGQAAVRQRNGDLKREGLGLYSMADWSVPPRGRVRLYAITLIISFVLLIACANVANLLMVRSAARSRELAVIASLGASRLAIVRAVLLETLLLAIAGGVAGALLAQVGVTSFGRAVASDIPGWRRFTLDGQVLLFAAGLVAVAAIGAGIAPSRRAAATSPMSALRGAERGSTGVGLGRASRNLSVIQVGLATTLVLLSGLIARGAVGFLSRSPVPAPTRMATARIELRRERYPAADDQNRLVEQVLANLRARRGVVGVAAGTTRPGFGGPSLPFALEVGAVRSAESPVAAVSAVTPGYFAALAIPVMAGREFALADRAGAPPTAVISESLAERYFPGKDPVGRTIVVGAPADTLHPGHVSTGTRTIVGVVADVPPVDDPALGRAAIYLPYAQVGDERMALTIRTAGPADGYLRLIGDAVLAADPDIPLYDAGVLSTSYREARGPIVALASLFAAFGAAALALALVGVFALVAFGVRQQARETAIRLALGESSGSVLLRIVRGIGLRALVGAVFGTAFVLGLAPAFGNALLGASPRDPLVFTTVLGAVGLAIAAAIALPALRVLRAEPGEVLRMD